MLPAVYLRSGLGDALSRLSTPGSWYRPNRTMER